MHLGCWWRTSYGMYLGLWRAEVELRVFIMINGGPLIFYIGRSMSWPIRTELQIWLGYSG